MPAVIFTGSGLSLAERETPSLSNDSNVAVRLRMTGICGTDRSIALGSFPSVPGVILGHEAVGEVVAVRGSTFKPGDRVVVNPTYYCGGCRYCRRGMAAHCPEKAGREIGVDRDGTLTSYIVMPERFVHRIPEGIDWRRAVGIEPLACVLNNLISASPRFDDRVVVLGAGPIGTLCALVLGARGTRVTIVEVDENRASIVRGILPNRIPVWSGIPSGHRPDLIIDAVGTQLEKAFELVDSNGTIVVMGEREGVTATIGARSLVTRGVRVIGAGPYSPEHFEMAIDLAQDLPLESLITHSFALERYVEAFTLLGTGVSGQYGAMKVLLTTNEDLI